MNEQRPSKELCEHDWVGDDDCAYCDAEAARDMLTDARLELDALRSALGVDYEPHQSLHERMLDAANHKRVERGVQGPCPNCGTKWASAELSSSHEPPAVPLTFEEEREEYARVRGLSDEAIVRECIESPLRVVRELANRYDVVCEKLEKASEPPGDALQAMHEAGRQVYGGGWIDHGAGCNSPECTCGLSDWIRRYHELLDLDISHWPAETKSGEQS